MPELPEVETVKRGIEAKIIGQKILDVVVRNPNFRWKVPSNVNKVLTNSKILNVKRRAKYLIITTSTSDVLVHLGMSGNLKLVNSKTDYLKHDHVEIILDSGKSLRLNDPRRFGCFLICPDYEQHPLIIEQGIEPLTSKFNGEYLLKHLKNKNVSIKTLIMNAKIVVGVGNIYASESLFKAKVLPNKPASQITIEEANEIVSCIKDTLKKAIKAGGTTLKDHSQIDGKPGYFAQKLLVYGREGEQCFQCESIIQKIILGQRSTFYCNNCQN
jgi:formamidopyrimidine-DNA glycosylase